MGKLYKIRDGFSFIDEKYEVKVGGDVIELDDDSAENHSHKLELVTDETVDTDPVVEASTPKAAKGKTAQPAQAQIDVDQAIDAAVPAVDASAAAE